MTPSKLCALLGCTTLVAGDIWSDCSTSAAHLKNLKCVHHACDPPVKVKGVKLNIGITGTLDEELTAGSLNVWIKFLVACACYLRNAVPLVCVISLVHILLLAVRVGCGASGARAAAVLLFCPCQCPACPCQRVSHLLVLAF
jgi:hypothetical protein